MNDFAELKREGLSIQAIKSATGFDRKTVRKYLLQPDVIPAYRPRPAAANKLDAFKPYLEERLQAGVWNAAVLLRELKQRSYTGGYTILMNWLQPQREAAQVVAVRRFETPPGRQAQVDWGHLGSLEGDHIERPLWGFTFTLGYSRMMMAAGNSRNFTVLCPMVPIRQTTGLFYAAADRMRSSPDSVGALLQLERLQLKNYLRIQAFDKGKGKVVNQSE